MIDLRQGDCKEVLKSLPDNSVDSIVTDPPYELGFMGKSWDSTGIANDATMWAECLRVLKPGGHLLAFSGTRTYHRMASAIEDAGFEIRDMIEWVYGCLSEDTEILTKNGWERYDISKKSSTFVENEILIYDTENDIYKWEKPQRWSEYNIHQDTAYRIKSDSTDQIVSRNHRCLIEREGKLVFIKAEELDKVELMPILSNSIFSKGKGEGEVLRLTMQWDGTGAGMETTRRQRQEGVVKRNRRELQVEPNGGKQSIMEGRFDIHEAEGQICKPINQVCAVSEGVFSDVKEGRVCDGAQIECCKRNRETLDTDGVRASHKPRCNGQQNREFNAIQNQCGTQEIRTRTSYNTTLATVEPFEYSGIIFCPTVSTGAFIARRNGNVFLTGNSGFPKSLNIGKKIDELQGNDREVVGITPAGKGIASGGSYVGQEYAGEHNITKGTSEWEGWGTALKPAHEPICMARKPLSEKTVAENCLKWGTGGINIDESRVGTEDNLNGGAYSGGERSDGDWKENSGFKNDKLEQFQQPIGRFPANLIHDNSEEVRECFPESKGALAPVKSGQKGFGGVIYGKYKQGGDDGATFYGDQSGNASRFFKSIIYQAKASKSERNKGCDGLEEKQSVGGGGGIGNYLDDVNSASGKFGSEKAPSKNNHPTVKPLDLMEYLITMVTPKNGTVLEPFMGSGTTGVAAVNLNRNFIGIEMDEHYFEIAEKRIGGAKNIEHDKQQVINF